MWMTFHSKQSASRHPFHCYTSNMENFSTRPYTMSTLHVFNISSKLFTCVSWNVFERLCWLKGPHICTERCQVPFFAYTSKVIKSIIVFDIWKWYEVKISRLKAVDTTIINIKVFHFLVRWWAWSTLDREKCQMHEEESVNVESRSTEHW